MPLRLTQLDPDALALVLLGLSPEARRRDWVFLALTCRALRAAVLVAARASEEERLGTVDRLPLGPAPKPSGKRFATSVDGIWTSPRRILFAKAHLACVEPTVQAFFESTHVPRRVRAAFAAALDYDPRQTRQQRGEVESRAAYHLSTDALYLLLAHAPLHTVRAAFFEVLGGGRSPRHFALDLSLEHHRALVMFASAHGRVDVLEWLVHRNPDRARAYDYENGLLQIFTDATAPKLAVDNLCLFVIDPAVHHGRAEVLQWLEAAVVALGLRQGPSQWNLRTSFRPIAGPEVRIVLCLAGLELGRAVPGSRTEMGQRQWKGFRDMVALAAAAGHTRVLDYVWTSVCSLVPKDDPEAAASIELRRFQAALAFAVLHTVLSRAHKHGDATRWLVAVCTRERDRLIELAEVTHGSAAVAMRTEGCHPDTFDFEDLVAAAVCLPGGNTSHRAVFRNMGLWRTVAGGALPVQVVDACLDLRRQFCHAGYAGHVEWLLDEVEHARAHGHLCPFEYNGGASAWSVGGFDRETNRGWFARALKFDSNGHFASTFEIAAEVAECRRTASDVVECIHDALLDRACKVANVEVLDHPHSKLPAVQLAHGRLRRPLGPWLAEEGWDGHTHATKAVAAVLRRHYALDKDFGTPPLPRMHRAVQACRFAIASAPKACYGAMKDAVDAERGDARFLKLLLEGACAELAAYGYPRGAQFVLERAYRDLAERVAPRAAARAAADADAASHCEA